MHPHPLKTIAECFGWFDSNLLRSRLRLLRSGHSKRILFVCENKCRLSIIFPSGAHLFPLHYLAFRYCWLVGRLTACFAVEEKDDSAGEWTGARLWKYLTSCIIVHFCLKLEMFFKISHLMPVFFFNFSLCRVCWSRLVFVIVVGVIFKCVFAVIWNAIEDC